MRAKMIGVLAGMGLAALAGCGGPGGGDGTEGGSGALSAGPDEPPDPSAATIVVARYFLSNGVQSNLLNVTSATDTEIVFSLDLLQFIPTTNDVRHGVLSGAHATLDLAKGAFVVTESDDCALTLTPARNGVVVLTQSGACTKVKDSPQHGFAPGVDAAGSYKRPTG